MTSPLCCHCSGMSGTQMTSGGEAVGVPPEPWRWADGGQGWQWKRGRLWVRMWQSVAANPTTQASRDEEESGWLGWGGGGDGVTAGLGRKARSCKGEDPSLAGLASTIDVIF
uniref:Uncharacterized protein n=1 Tax=Oryza glumipatula TaxID=40148 RepID=A0A0E0AVP2_9ORYZ